MAAPKPKTCRAPPPQYRNEADLTNRRRGSGLKPMCILLYHTAARNGGGIPIPVVCPVRYMFQIGKYHGLGRDHHEGEENRLQYTV